MATISDLNVRLGLLYNDFDKSLSAVEKKLERSGRKFSQLGNDLALSVSLPLAALGASAIKQAGEIESLKLAMVATFGTAGRSAAEATKEVEALRIAAKAPGLDFEQAVKGSIRLQGVGIAAEDARGILEKMANAIALTGGTADDLDGVTRQFAQMISKGRVLQEDVSIISERMPIVAELMQRAFGTRSVEAIRASGVSAKEFVARITEAAGSLKTVEGGIKNALVNASAEARNSLATLGEAIIKAFDVTGKLESFTKGLQGAVEWFKNLSEGTQKAIVQVGLFGVVIGPALKVVGALSGGLAQVVGAFGSMVGVLKNVAAGLIFATSSMNAFRVSALIATGGIAAIVLGIATAVYAVSDSFDAAEFAATTFADASAEVRKEAAAEVGELNKNITALKDVRTSTDDRKKAADALLAAYPNYLSGINLEAASLADLNKIQKELTGNIIAGIAERKKASAVNTLYEKQADILLRIQEIQRTGKVTAAESNLVDSGDAIAAGYSITGAVVKKLQQQISDLGTQANTTAADFDKAFGLQQRALDLQLEKEYAARQSAEDLRSEYSAMGNAVVKNTKETVVSTDATKGKTKALKDEFAELDKIIQALEDANEQEAKAGIGEIKRTTPIAQALPQVGTGAVVSVNINPATVALESLKNNVESVSLTFEKIGMTIGERAALASEVWEKNFAGIYSAATNLANGIVGLQKARGEEEKKSLDEEYAGKLAAAQGNADATAAIEAELAAKKAAIDKKRGKAAKGVAIATAIIDTAVGVTKALGSAPPPFNFVLAALTAAAGAVQVATIKAQPFADGGVVSKPTLGLVGEYPGASLNKEIITPERLMRSIVREEGGGINSIQVYGVIKGSDIEVSNRKAERERGRVR